MKDKIFLRILFLWQGRFSKTAVIVLCFIIFVHLYVLSQLMFFPYPELFVYPYLTNQGLLPYKQIFDQHFPGLFFLPLNFEVLGLTNEYIARWWQAGLISITQILLYVVSLKIFKNHWQALKVNGLYLIWQPFFQGWVLWINNILTIFYLLAFYFTFQSVNKKKVTIDVFLVGMMLGLATIFKQVAIPLSGLVFLYLFFKLRNIKTLIYFAGGFLLPIGAMLGYIGWIGVLKDFWFWTVQFNLTTYAQLGGSAPESVAVKRILFVLIPVWLGLLSSIKQTALLVLIFLFGGFLAGGNNFDFTYFQPSLPFVCLATVISFLFLRKIKIGWILIGLYLLVTIKWWVPFYQSHSQNFVYYFDQDTKQSAEVVQNLTEPGEEVFVFGVTPLIYQMSETLPAGKVFVYQFPWFLADSNEQILNGLRQSNPRIIVSDPSVSTKGQVISQFAPDLYNYIYSHYQLRQKIGTIEILEKK